MSNFRPDQGRPNSLSVVPAAAPKRRRLSRLPRLLSLGGLGLLGIFACLALGLLAAYVSATSDLPTGSLFGAVMLKQSTKIYDRNGGLLFESLDPQGGLRTVVKPEEIPLVLKQATIATEDPTFYHNWGVDPVAVLRAVYYNVRYGRLISGGSTITQQLVKNALLSPDQTLDRKLHEAALAVEVTRRFPKEQILTAYLNTIYYGNRAYGIQSAAQAYFNKDVSQLDLAEASLLAGLPQAPALYDPCQDEDAALSRQAVVLGLMVKTGYISDADAQRATDEMTTRLKSADFARHCDVDVQTALRAPHFVNWVQALLEDRYGPEVIYKGGLQVTTSLDPAVQAVVEEEARKQVAALRGQGVSNAAVVAIRPATGEVVAMLGSVDYANKAIAGQVNVAERPRQPGSSIKPIGYVTAFKNGWTPATPIYDLKTQFPDGSRPPYVPSDYDNKERGLVSVRTALANSLNIPAVKAVYATSVRASDSTGRPLAMMETARNLGITTFDDAEGQPLPFGLALALGGGEVKLTELTGAYAAFANQGARMPVTPFLKIVDADGKILVDITGSNKPKPICSQFDAGSPNEQPTAQETCPHSAPYAYLITSILSDNQARTPVFGANSPLLLSRPAAAKTGTTNSFRDNWTLGYTPDLAVGVWMGNDNNAAMQSVPGSMGAAPIWHNVMERVLNDVWHVPARDFPVPAGVTRAEICIESGMLPTNACPADHRRTEVFVSGHEPRTQDSVWQQVNCPAGQSGSGLYMQPPHDVGDLIPYSQIIAWAQQAGWNVSASGSGCTAPPAVQPQPGNPDTNKNKPDNNKDQKHDQPPGRGKDKKHKN